jgi:ABC-type lipoprotein release transport system permease subunit
MIFKQAWRNIWRNKRRTAITISSGLFAVFFAILMRSMQLGSYDKMISDSVNSYTGYLQIHKNGYWDDKTIDNSFVRDTALEKTISKLKHITAVVPRMESFALVSSGVKTKGAIIIGIDPLKEGKLSNLTDKLKKGKLLESDDTGVLVAQGLAKYLNVTVGDTLVLIGQGYHGMSAAGKYAVRGILHFPVAELNKGMIYLTLAQAQFLYSCPNMLSSLSIGLDEPHFLDLAEKEIKKQTDLTKYEVMDWKKMLVELVQFIQTDNTSGIVMLGILYMIIGFGIFGTVVMMTAERLREFAIVVALGARKWFLIKVVWLETFFLGIFSIILGALLALPVVAYFHAYPILLTGDAAKSMEIYGMEPVMPFALRADFFLHQAYVILLIIGISAIYPALKLAFLTVVKELKH